MASETVVELEGLRAQSPLWQASEATVSASTRLQGRGNAPEKKMIMLSAGGANLWCEHSVTKADQACTSHRAIDLGELVTPDNSWGLLSA